MFRALLAVLMLLSFSLTVTGKPDDKQDAKAKEIRAEIATLRDRIATLEKQLAELNGSGPTVPGKEAEAVIRLTNELRTSEKAPVLKANKTLMKVAQDHADNMAKQDKFGDDDKNGHVLDGKKPKDRIEASDYKFLVFGEISLWNSGQDDPAAAAVATWKSSPRLRAHMVDGEYVELGVGVATGKSGRVYFVQVFGAPMK